MQKLRGKVALITGASHGIGRAIAQGYAKEGATVVVTGRTEENLNQLVEEAKKDGLPALAIPADLEDAATPAYLVERVLEKFGTIDILVNNAGVGSSAGPSPVVTFDDALWHRTLNLNLTAPYLLCKASLPTMLKNKKGRIVNIASIVGKLPVIHGAAYSVSKHGLLGLTRTLAIEVARDGITVNAICPGPVRTRINDLRIQYDANRLGVTLDEFEANITPIGRRLEPEEIVPMAILLALDESAAITGQAFNVCGGVAT